MYKSPLEEFLDLTELQTNPDYVSNLLKTAYSKNITIQDWNTFIDQFQALISRDAATYLGFKNVLKEIRLYQKYIDDTNNIFIRYSANSDGTDFTEEWSEEHNYIGFATGQTAPTNKNDYEWISLSNRRFDELEARLNSALGSYITDIDTLVGEGV